MTLGQGFYDLGYEVHILRFKPKIEYKLSEDLNYHQLNFYPYKKLKFNLLIYKAFAKAVDKYVAKYIGKPILTLSNLDTSDRVMRYSKLPNVAYVIRNTISKKMEMFDGDKLMSRSTLSKVYSQHPCICISEGVEKDFRQTLDVTNTTTIYNPIDKQQVIELSQDFVPEYKDYIIHVGSFKAQKAHDILIKAYAKTKMTFPLLLLGKGSLMSSMQELTKSLGIDDRVIFMGFKKNPYPYIKKARFMVLSSNFEGFGRVIAESLAVGTPVISTDCPSGPSELLPLNNLVPVSDIDALANKLDQAMADITPYKSEFDERLLPSKIAKMYLEFMGV